MFDLKTMVNKPKEAFYRNRIEYYHNEAKSARIMAEKYGSMPISVKSVYEQMISEAKKNESWEKEYRKRFYKLKYC